MMRAKNGALCVKRDSRYICEVPKLKAVVAHFKRCFAGSVWRQLDYGKLVGRGSRNTAAIAHLNYAHLKVR